MLTRSRRWLSLSVVAVATVVLFSSLWLHASSPPDPPTLIPYTGYLQQNGVPATGTVTLLVALYDPTNTTPIWTDSFATVSVVNGRFDITLGGGAVPIDAGYISGTKGSGQPLQLAVTVNGTALTPRQTLHIAPYAIAAATANRSAGDFAINGGLSFTNLANLAISFIVAGDAPNGIAYRPAGAADSLAIAGAGTSLGTRLIRLFDNVIVNGTVTATQVSTSGSIVAGGGLTPDVDTGWFEVYSDPAQMHPPQAVTVATAGTPVTVYRDPTTKDIYISHFSAFLPSKIAIQACGGFSTPGVCATPVTLTGASGYHDSGTDINPSISYASGLNTLVLAMVPDWWTYAYLANGAWTCPSTPSGNCFSGYYRVLAWR